MTTDAPELGLRERKRLATRRAIQVAVLELTREHGLEHVTVDEISRVADVSPRTFFNYFSSKEEAIMGESPTLPNDEAIERFVEAGPQSDLLFDLGEMIATSGDDAAPDFELVGLRRELMKLNPQLFALRMATMRNFEEQLASIVARRLANDHPALDDSEVQQRAGLITLVAFATMRHAWKSWADSGGTAAELSDRLRASFAQLRALVVPEVVK